MPKITLVLHNIRSTHNVGSIFRTAEGFGVEKILLCGYTPYPAIQNDPRLPHIKDKLTQQIHKTALGAETMVPFEYYEIPPVPDLRHQGYSVVALEQDKRSIPLSDYKPAEKIALLLGEEVNGITSELLDEAGVILEIPMKGRKESFNVSIAAGITLYALLN